MISSTITRTSAALLLGAGMALLFASDAILPRVLPTFPASAAFLGQLVGAAWIGVATLNWSNRDKILGGIYGQPVVIANLTVYLVSALVLFKAPPAAPDNHTLRIVALPMALMAVAYGILLYRGPFDATANTNGKAQ